MFRRALCDALDGSEIAALRAASSILIDFVNEWSLERVPGYSDARARTHGIRARGGGLSGEGCQRRPASARRYAGNTCQSVTAASRKEDGTTIRRDVAI
jgi:hypothetical protein